jgi:hypothetical protein
MRWLLCSLIIWLVLILPAHAQIQNSLGGLGLGDALGALGSIDALTGEQISIILDPQFPAPGDVFIARLDDYAISNFGATIIWTLDGQELTQFRNARSISVRAGAVGQTMRLEVALYGSDQRTYTTRQNITPRFLDVIIEPITYAPAHYAGRPLPIYGSQVLLTALLHEKTGLVNHADYTYSWQIEHKYIDGGPVRGKYKTFITIPHGQNILITLDIRDRNGQSVARRLFNIPSVNVDTQFYEVNPLFGMSTKAITNGYRLLSQSSTIYAIPYNLDLYARPEVQSIEWRIDGRRVDPGNNPYQLTVSSVTGSSARLQFKIRNTIELLQGDDKNVTISF